MAQHETTTNGHIQNEHWTFIKIGSYLICSDVFFVVVVAVVNLYIYKFYIDVRGKSQNWFFEREKNK